MAWARRQPLNRGRGPKRTPFRRRVKLEQKPGNRRLKTHRESAADRQWKRAVRLRDDYTCQRCGVQQPYIHAHHIAPRGRRPDLIHDVDNGMCLCFECHRYVHEHPKESTAQGFLSDEKYEKKAA